MEQAVAHATRLAESRPAATGSTFDPLEASPISNERSPATAEALETMPGHDPGGHNIQELCGRFRADRLGRPDCLRLVHDQSMQGPDRPGWRVYCAETDARQQRPLTVSVVIPAMNEARNLPAVLLQIPEESTDVVIVDGCSSDNTLDVVRELCPRATVVEQKARGKGAALAAGFAAAKGDIIVMIDADGSMSPREFPAFVDTLVRGADFAKGSRNLREGGSADLTFLRNLGNRFLGAVFNALHGTAHTDLCYGYMAFWRTSLPALMPDTPGFEVETWMNIRAAEAGLKVSEVPSYEGRRVYGESNLHPVRDGLRVLRTLLRGGMTRRRAAAPTGDAPVTAQRRAATRTAVGAQHA